MTNTAHKIGWPMISTNKKDIWFGRHLMIIVEQDKQHDRYSDYIAEQILLIELISVEMYTQ